VLGVAFSFGASELVPAAAWDAAQLVDVDVEQSLGEERS
jgi:hypothetical protein